MRVNESLKDSIWTLRDILFQKNEKGDIDAVGYEVQVAKSYFYNKKGAELPGADKRKFIDNSDFTGKIILYTLKNKAIKGEIFISGHPVSNLIAPMKRKDFQNVTMGQQGMEQEQDCSENNNFGSENKACTPSGKGPELEEVKIIEMRPPLPDFNWVFPPTNPANNPATGPGTQMPIGNPGGGGGSGGTGNNQGRELKTDAIKAKYPCLDKKILQILFNSAEMGELVGPFLTDQKPTITYESKDLEWGSTKTGGIFELGNTRYDPTSTLGLSSVVTLNNKLIDNSSPLLIAATVVHETMHAFINYNISTAKIEVRESYRDNSNWMAALNGFYLTRELGPNYSQHYYMLTDYFSKGVRALQYWNSEQNAGYTNKEMAMAMMYGLKTVDEGTPQSYIDNINIAYDMIKKQCMVSDDELAAFHKSQLVSIKTLSTTGCN
ncbi:hypothetical protein TH53_26230 [Pedobacter lusitanus]|uniref:Contig186, whole genome shotgun sequence n=1 Tax=Pedobacter lusitanus TaxID=1503925 RepID=A0A0D0GB25_9SPHI|nr:hypothetical protein [Pedobacter lusitanus]KIO74472.1 hypothetical protein TH53_26230 [Pedobacter lusitanus]